MEDFQSGKNNDTPSYPVISGKIHKKSGPNTSLFLQYFFYFIKKNFSNKMFAKRKKE